MDAHKEQIAIQRLKSFEPDDGYHLCYSGGKDSDVIRILADLAGVKHENVHNLTTVDAPETVQYIKSLPDVRIDYPKTTMWKLIEQKTTPPTRMMRYCCEKLKEHSGVGKVKVTGEFVCDEIHSILQVGNMNSRQYDYRAVTGDDTLLNDDVFDFACISKKAVNTYLKGQKGYGWHISELIIYDKPKELGEFHQPCECLDEYEDEVYCDCFNCDYARDSDYGVIACRRTITRPPQSWCYVERLVGE